MRKPTRNQPEPAQQPLLGKIVGVLPRLTAEELQELNRSVVYALRAGHHARQRAAASVLHPGVRVSWDSRRRGDVVRGVVSKVNSVSVIVDVDGGGRIRVSPSLLTVVKSAAPAPRGRRR